MDAAYDSDDLREFIDKELGAVAHIKCNPTRSAKHPIDWHLYKERHLVECFFNRIKRFRRIALRCEKTFGSFKAFVSLACAMAWISRMQTTPSPHASRYEADVTCPFLVRTARDEVLLQELRCDVEGVITVGGALEFPAAANSDAILAQ